MKTLSIFDVRTHASEPTGSLPLQPDISTDAPSGHVLQDAAMGWSLSDLDKDENLILSTQGVFMMTGTCLVPDGEFNLRTDDVVRITVRELKIENRMQA